MKTFLYLAKCTDISESSSQSPLPVLYLVAAAFAEFLLQGAGLIAEAPLCGPANSSRGLGPPSGQLFIHHMRFVLVGLRG